MIVNSLEILNGDCIILYSNELINKTNILIDGGFKVVNSVSIDMKYSPSLDF